MVVMHVKQSDERQFLYECSALESVDTVIRELVVINNLQLRILHLTEECQQLAIYGPSKSTSEKDEGDESEDDEVSTTKDNSKEGGAFHKRDPSNRRTGEGKSPLQSASNL